MMKKFLISLLVATCGMAAPHILIAQTPAPAYNQYTRMAVPGNGGYDYLSLDTVNRRLYISHGTSVNVLDLTTGQLAGSVDKLQGVHGIAIANDLNKGFISDGKGNAVVVFDLGTLKVLQTILITGKDPDAILYDLFTHQVFAFNADSQDASVIDGQTMKQTSTIALGGTPEFAVSDGQGKLYNNLEDKSMLNVIDCKTLKVTNTYPLAPCGAPTGLALDKTHQRLFTVCRQNKGMTVLDLMGKVVTTVPIGSGADALVYDGSTGMIYCSNGDGTATIIHQDTPDHYTVVQTLSTQWKAKTLALDPVTKTLYFSAFDLEGGNKNRVAGSFHLLIFKPKT